MLTVVVHDVLECFDDDNDDYDSINDNFEAVSVEKEF